MILSCQRVLKLLNRKLPSYLPGYVLHCPDDGVSTQCTECMPILMQVAASRNVVAFTGAGISTACGIPDFRGPSGIWTLQRAGRPIPEFKVSFAIAKPSLTHQVPGSLIAWLMLMHIHTINEAKSICSACLSTPMLLQSHMHKCQSMFVLLCHTLPHCRFCGICLRIPLVCRSIPLVCPLLMTCNVVIECNVDMQ